MNEDLDQIPWAEEKSSVITYCVYVVSMIGALVSISAILGLIGS